MRTEFIQIPTGCNGDGCCCSFSKNQITQVVISRHVTLENCFHTTYIAYRFTVLSIVMVIIVTVMISTNQI